MARGPARAGMVEIDRSEAGILAIRGALTFATARQAFTDGGRALAEGAQTHLDLAGVTQADSAGLACVIALAAAASRSGRQLRIANWPEGLRALGQVCGVIPLLEPMREPA
ncbi:MAG TPA: STAS domain-containing protein [Rhodanobacteraceae bacterium]|nr:STAS domain-containing protein [Rhodanobacteraceae bacterium]